MLQCIDLTGWWQIKFDARDEGTQLGWAQQPPADSAPINVPSCWNNVLHTNHKGMVDFYRRPKRAYFVMREKFAEWQCAKSPH